MSHASAVCPSLKAGVGRTDITPPRGTHLVGDTGRWRPAEFVLDPLYARALVLEGEDGKRVCIVSADVMAFQDYWSDLIHQRLATEYGFNADAILLHATHPHSAPSVGDLVCSKECQAIPPEYPWLRCGDSAYNDSTVNAITKAVGEAIADLSPVSVGVGTAIEARCGFNRRFVMRDGTVKSHPGPERLPDVLHVEGPTDPEIGIVSFAGPDLRKCATLLNFTCHPTHGQSQRWVSADWPGLWSAGFVAATGGDGDALVLNGCCGNIHHANHLDPTYVDTMERMAQLLTETSASAARHLQYQPGAVLDYHVRKVSVPLRTPSSQDVAAAEALLAANPEPMWIDDSHTAVRSEWIYAVSLTDHEQSRQSNPNVDVAIQVIRIGNIAIVGIPGEPFVEMQLHIKANSPVRHTFVAHNTNAFAGYIPTRSAFAAGGYETWPCYWSRLAPEAFELLCDEAVAVLRDVFD